MSRTCRERASVRWPDILADCMQPDHPAISVAVAESDATLVEDRDGAILRVKVKNRLPCVCFFVDQRPGHTESVTRTFPSIRSPCCSRVVKAIDSRSVNPWSHFHRAHPPSHYSVQYVLFSRAMTTISPYSCFFLVRHRRNILATLQSSQDWTPYLAMVTCTITRQEQ